MKTSNTFQIKQIDSVVTNNLIDAMHMRFYFEDAITVILDQRFAAELADVGFTNVTVVVPDLNYPKGLSIKHGFKVLTAKKAVKNGIEQKAILRAASMIYNPKKEKAVNQFYSSLNELTAISGPGTLVAIQGEV